MMAVIPPIGTEYILFHQRTDPGRGALIGKAVSVGFSPIRLRFTPPDVDKEPFEQTVEYTKYKTDDGRIFYEYEVYAYIAESDREVLRIMITNAGGNAEELLGPEPKSKWP
jgi:hypothetical protein